MGDPRGFMKVGRKNASYRPVCERIKDYSDVVLPLAPEHSREQASRCMDCGTPFCHWGCPLGNNIPEWNDKTFVDNWDAAYRLLSGTNNFPEITGRICPAPCEYACVLGLNDEAVTIRQNELSIIERAFDLGLVIPQIPAERTGKKVSIIGSGPAGLACASELNKKGHKVTVYEKDDLAGGLMRYGIPDFKLEKSILDRRLDIMRKEGIEIITGASIGDDIPLSEIAENSDAVCVAIGSRHPRDINAEGRHFKGIHFAMEYLKQGNEIASGIAVTGPEKIEVKDKKVVVIGGGDTGSDCVGTANRQGASCVTQIELMPMPENCRRADQPWPLYPMLLRTSSSHEEGAERKWSVLTKKFTGKGGRVTGLDCVEVEFSENESGTCPVMKERTGSSFHIDADVVIIAAGFVSPVQEGLIETNGINTDARKNISTDSRMMTNVEKIFSAGDSRRGQSLVVWAIVEGRECAGNIHEYLKQNVPGTK